MNNFGFTFNLPNEVTVFVDLSFCMLEYSHLIHPDKTYTAETSAPDTKFVSVEKFLKKFRQDVIKKKYSEQIPESAQVFHRLFKLVRSGLKIYLEISCSYVLTYVRKLLKVVFLRCREVDNEEFLSNSEIESIDLNLQYLNSEIVFVSDLKQIFKK